MNKVVSIITPSYNRADLVLETAASIFQQDYPFWEWVIVEDGSTDNSWQVLQELEKQDSRVKIFKRDREPKGACACRNIAVEKCTGDYVLFLDTDDLLAPFCLRQRVEAAQEHDDCDFVIFPMLLFEKRWDDLGVLWNVDDDRDDLSRILTGDPICQGTGTLWKKSSFETVGMWREDLKLWQDIELHIRSLLFPLKFAKRFDLEPDVYLRTTPNSLSRGGYYSPPKIKSRISVLEFTVKRMKEAGLTDRYRKELKHLATDIAISTILSGQFKQTKFVLDLVRQFEILDRDESRKLFNWMSVRRYKFYKLPAVDQYFAKKASANCLDVPGNIGKIHWTPRKTNQNKTTSLIP